MKNLLIPFLAFTILTLSSCFKVWTCECEADPNAVSQTPNATTAESINNQELTAPMFKKRAKQECDKIKDNIATFNGISSSDVDCKLK